jgi:hypothetical protein
LSVSGLAGGFAATGVEKVPPVAPASSFASLNLGGGSSTGTTRTNLIKPVTDDDLFSMLNDTSAAPSAFNRTAASSRLQVPPIVKGAVATPLSSSLSDSGTKKPTVGRSRLQAKKLEASKTDWDDF